MPFEKGNKLGVGGKRKNSGPAPDWLKARCRELVQRNRLINFLVDVATGKPVERTVTIDGSLVNIPASIKDRRAAIEYLIDRGWGKPSQEIAHTGDVQLTDRVIVIKTLDE